MHLITKTFPNVKCVDNAVIAKEKAERNEFSAICLVIVLALAASWIE